MAIVLPHAVDRENIKALAKPKQIKIDVGNT